MKTNWFKISISNIIANFEDYENNRTLYGNSTISNFISYLIIGEKCLDCKLFYWMCKCEDYENINLNISKWIVYNLNEIEINKIINRIIYILETSKNGILVTKSGYIKKIETMYKNMIGIINENKLV